MSSPPVTATEPDRRASAADRLGEAVGGAEGGVAKAFATTLFADLEREDLQGRSADDLYAIAFGLWRLAGEREAGRWKIRAYNPTLQGHGWESRHTVLEIVNDDMPFLVDSVAMALHRNDLETHLLVHPVIRLVRDDAGRLTAIETDEEEPLPGATIESVMYIEIDRRTDPVFLEALVAEIGDVLAEVRAAVDDWRRMRERTLEIAAEIEAATLPIEPRDSSEVIEFLRWIEDDNFVFLGYRCYDLVEDDGEDALAPVADSGLGILREMAAQPRRRLSLLSGKAKELAREPELLILTKANSRSTIHRPIYFDYVGVKRFDATGHVVGEHRLLGLYTDRAYSSNPARIPVLRRRVEQVMARSGKLPPSHDGKALLRILETLPRAELFQASPDELYETAIAVLRIEGRKQVRLLVRRDRYERFFACLAFVPRDRYNTELRERIQQILLSRLGGNDLQFSLTLSDVPLARVYFVVRGDDLRPEVDVAELEARIALAARDWRDDLQLALEEVLGEEIATELGPRYRNAFSPAYRSDFVPRIAAADIVRMEALGSREDLGVAVYRRPEDEVSDLRVKLYRRDEPLLLCDLLPILENLGLQVLGERPYEIERSGAGRVFVHDFYTRHLGPADLELGELERRLDEALQAVWAGRVEDDGFHRLIVRSRLRSRQIALLRTICRYLQQVRVPWSQAYMERAVTGNEAIAELLVELFETRFDPALSDDRDTRLGACRAGIEAALEEVPSLDEDRILRAFLAVVEATDRVNVFQSPARPYVALKLAPQRLDYLPRPRPLHEIYVYAPRFEGVHLRSGGVARGGLRWSDRLEDYRTEVLGLMKAQVVKNAVIVPVGAKGGFVVRPDSAGGAPSRDEVVACYQDFIRGLLDLTDNLVEGKVEPPPDVVRYDGDDPYLVVAADKGTATFSDIANGVAAEYDFWLGDGFASGGSAGYDHKKMGITARGGWESVERHFRALDLRPERSGIRAVGIGDMSGDVFGNGMLRSEHLRLVAAFNHRHVFVDPDPDPAVSFAERQRLFEAGGGWDAYDATLISAGGGVFDRSEKSIETTPEMRRALDFDDERLTPAELIRHVLRAPVDLLWNGGIGTFVKASDETHADANDRTNDGLRVDAAELRAKVVAEGGNLGLTQRARIEFAIAGGLVNTDFIDNSGGVDCSDHEVNIKILLNGEVAAGNLTGKHRDEVLEAHSEEVAESVLLDNYRQALAISIAESRAAELLEAHGRVIRSLEVSGRIDRVLENLPSDEELAERKTEGVGLTRPELAVLLAWAKIDVKSLLLESEALDDPHFTRELESYFGRELSTRFPDAIAAHPLRRNIVATKVTNSLVNRAGPRFVHQIMEVTGADAADVVRAFVSAREVFGLRRHWLNAEALDDTTTSRVQIGIFRDSVLLLERATRWFLRRCHQGLNVADCVDRFTPGVTEVMETMPELLASHDAARLDKRTAALVANGVPEETARRASVLGLAFPALDIVEVAQELDTELGRAGGVYFRAGERLGLRSLQRAVAAAPIESHWHELARIAAGDEIGQIQKAVCSGALQASPGKGAGTGAVGAWISLHQPAVEQLRRTLAEMRGAGAVDWAMISVALREARRLADLSRGEV